MKLGFTGRIARSSARRPWLTVAAWGIALGAAVFLAGGLGDALVQDEKNLVTTESDTADAFVADLEATDPAHQTHTELVFVVSPIPPPWRRRRSPQPSNRRARPSPASTASRTSRCPRSRQPALVSESGRRRRHLAVTLAHDFPEEVGAAHQRGRSRPLMRPASPWSHSARRPQVRCSTALGEEGLVKGELIGISVALVILVIVFGAFVAAGPAAARVGRRDHRGDRRNGRRGPSLRPVASSSST